MSLKRKKGITDSIEISRLLLNIGLNKDIFIESVVVVKNNDEIINVLPLGLKYDRGFLIANVYRGSRTYELLSNGLANKFTICITQKPETFFYAIFRKDIAIKLFTESKCSRKLCDVCIDAEIRDIEQEDQFIRVVLHPVQAIVVHGYPKGFTRASAAIIEALIYFTKMSFATEEEKRKYFERIKLMKEIVYRSSERGIYRELIDDIVDKALRYI